MSEPTSQTNSQDASQANSQTASHLEQSPLYRPTDHTHSLGHAAARHPSDRSACTIQLLGEDAAATVARVAALTGDMTPAERLMVRARMDQIHRAARGMERDLEQMHWAANRDANGAASGAASGSAPASEQGAA